MKSCLYACRVLHERLLPRRNRFAYGVFQWALDLDEIDALARRFWLFSRNRWNLFSFYDADHLPAPDGRRAGVKDNILAQLAAHGVETAAVQRIQLVTHVRVFGYVFNPVSFYFAFDAQDRPLAALAEVGNTFGEQKPFVLGRDVLRGNVFQDRRRKFFYVSPFLNLDLDFDFRLPVPGDRLALAVHTTSEGKPVLLATLTGERRPLTAARLAGYALRFPLMTLQVIGLIHWQAFRLWLRGLPYLKKAAHPELQREVYHG